MKQKVMFLGCNKDQIPYLIAVKKLGFSVIGTDRNPQAPSAKLADKFHNAGYTDMDKLKQIAVSENFTSEDKIFTAAAHFAYEGAAAVAEHLKIPYISGQTVDICLDKSKLYEFFKRVDIPVPETRMFNPGNPAQIDPSRIYYLKSDFGKSPNYCYRIVNGNIPDLPQRFDPYYRQTFLLQEEISGTHFRLNFYSDQVSVFLKLSDSACVPLHTIGLEHRKVVGKINKALEILGLKPYLVKLDVIINDEGCYVIDIGLDPPLRLMLLCDFLGLDFAMAYTRYYLTGEQSALPVWTDICKTVLISGTPQKGFSFTKFYGDNA